MTIQNLIYMYDQSTKSRSTAKLNYYYKLLLAESLTTADEKKEIEARLKTIDEPINFKKK